MTDTDVLRGMINSSAIIDLEGHNKRKKVVLIEPETEGCQLKILGIPSDAIVIDVDTNFRNDELFVGNSGECKRLDFIIISESKNVVLFIEMKKGEPRRLSDVKKQLKGGLCVFEYCQSIAGQFFGEQNFLKNYKKCFVVFKKMNVNKKPLTQNRNKALSSPDNPVLMSRFKSVEFNKIAA